MHCVRQVGLLRFRAPRSLVRSFSSEEIRFRPFDREKLLEPVLKGQWAWRVPFTDAVVPEVGSRSVLNPVEDLRAEDILAMQQEGAEYELSGPRQIGVNRSAINVFTLGTDYLGVARRANHVMELNNDSPQLALVGRSNVGKSSLLNKLLGLKKNKGSGSNKIRKAVVSKRPGRTDALHVYGIGRNDSFRHRSSLSTYRVLFVDCPGYGFARVNDGLSKGMSKAIASFLEDRDKVLFAAAVVLVDARLGLTPLDQSMLGMLEFLQCKYQIVLTKCDAAKREDLDKSVESVATWLAQEDQTCGRNLILGVSSKSKGCKNSNGIDLLKSELLYLADTANPSRKRTTTKRFVQP